jgi:hypothetical protein
MTEKTPVNGIKRIKASSSVGQEEIKRNIHGIKVGIAGNRR